MTMRRSLWIVVAIVAVYGALCARAVDYDYAWDDVAEIARSPALDGSFADGIRATQVERIDPTLAHTAGISLAYDSYRPVLFATYWLEARAWGRRPGPMHVDNLLAGAIAIALAYLLARRLVGETLGLVATAIFALHPLHVEAVVYISGRGDLLAGLFALATTLLALRARDSKRRRIAWTAAAGVAFAISLLAKESCVGLPLVLVPIGWATGARRRDAWIPLVLAVVAALVMALRASVIATSSNLAFADAIVRLPAVGLIYLRSAILPFDLSTERPFDPSLVIAGWIVVAAVFAGLAYAVVRRGCPRVLPAGIAGLAWWAVLIAPTAVVVSSTAVVSDRYMYVPLFGLAIAAGAAVAAVVRARPSLRPVAIVVGIVWGGVLLLVTWRQVPVWSNDITLDENAIAMVPDSGAAHWRLGSIQAQASRWDDAAVELAKAVELDPTNYHALDNLGVVYLRVGRVADAEQVLSRAVGASPPRSSYRPLFNLGTAQLLLGKQNIGCESIRRAVTARPGYAPAEQALHASCAPTPMHPAP